MTNIFSYVDPEFCAAIEAHHGGGYSYRLAPADAPLTENTFNKMPLEAVGPSYLRWDGDKSTQRAFNATRITEGTYPKGSQWTKNPLPGPPMLWEREGPSFAPYCEESQECKDTAHRWTRGDHWHPPPGVCKCSGSPNVFAWLLPNLEIVDTLHIPSDTKPGKYVLNWRWDCE